MKLSDITSIVSISQTGAEFSITLSNPDPDKLMQDLYYLDNHGYLAKAASDEEGRNSGVPEHYREGIDDTVTVKSSLYRLNKVASAMAAASAECKRHGRAKDVSRFLPAIIEFFRPCDKYEFVPGVA